MSTDRLVDLLERASRLTGPEREALLRRIEEEDAELCGRLRLLLGQEPPSLAERIARQYGPNADPRVSLEGNTESLPDFTSEVLQRLAGRGDSYGRYKLKGEVARGGQGAVLRVWDEDLCRNLAMKVVLGKEDRAAGDTPEVDTRTLGRFLEEAQVTGQLDHPGIVPVHELGLDSEGQVYFTMKLVKGEDLRAIFAKVRAGEDGWSSTRALGVLLKVCDAMAYAHTKGVIHRDLKPGNVMVGKFGEVYTMDWGLARVLGRDDGKLDPILSDSRTIELRSMRHDRVEDSPDSPLVTLDGDVVGTPAYMPPEQAFGRLEEMGPHSDVYAVGAILYDLCSGRVPYSEPGKPLNNYVIWSKVQQGPPDSLLEVAPSTPAELVSICEKAMARQPSERYADMRDMAADLRAYLENHVVKAHRTGAVIELSKWVQRNRLLASACAALILALAAGLGASLHLRRLEVHARGEAEVARTAAQTNLDQFVVITEFLSEVLAAPSPWAEGQDVTLVEMLDGASERLESSLDETPEAKAALHAVLGRTYSGLGQREEAYHHLSVALASQRELLGPDDPETLGTMQALLETAIGTNRLREAEALATEVVARSERVLGRDHEATLMARLSSGKLLLTQEKLPACETLLEDVLVRARRVLSPEHAVVTSALHLLASCLDRQARFEEAYAYHQECVTLRRRILGDDHPTTLLSIGNLALHFGSRGMLAQAEAPTRTVLETRLRVLPEDHHQTLKARNNLGTLLEELGKLEEAEEEFRTVLVASRRSLRQDHPDTLEALNNLAWTLFQQGELVEAEALFREVLATRPEVTDDSTRIDALARNSLAQLLRRLGRQAEALSLTEAALEIRTRLLGRTHPDTLASLSDLAGELENAGRLEEALEFRHEIVEGLSEHLSPEHDLFLTGRNNLAWNRYLSGELEQAEELFRETLEARRRVNGDDHASTLNTLDNLVQVLRRRGKNEEAEPLLTELVGRRRQLLGDLHDKPQWSMGELGILLVELDDLERAEEVLRELVEIQLDQLGPGHFYLGRSFHLLAVALLAGDQLQEAEALLRDALEIRRRNFSPRDLPLLETIGKLGECLLRRGQLEEAEELLLEMHASLVRTVPSTHGHVAWCLERLVELYEALGREEDAATWRALRQE